MNDDTITGQDSLGVKPPVPMPTPPNAAPPAGMQAQQQAQMKQRQELAKQEQAQAQQNTGKMQAFGEKSKGLAGQEKAEITAMGEQPSEPKMNMDVLNKRQASEMFPLLMVMAAVMGGGTNNPASAAMNNMTGVMKGQMEGDDARVKHELGKFHENANAAKQRLVDYNTRAKAIHEKYQGDQAQIDSELYFLNLEIGLDSKSRNFAGKMLDGNDRAVAKWGSMHKTVPNIDVSDAQVAMVMRGGTRPQVFGYGAGANLQYGEAIKRASKQMAQAEGISEADAGAKLLAQQYETKGLGSALASNIKMGAGIEYSSEKIKNDLNTMEGVFKEIEKKDAQFGTKLMNTPVNALKTHMSDPDLGRLKLAVEQVALEYERSMHGGAMSVAQLNVAAAEDAKKLLSSNMSLLEMRAKTPLMLQEMANARGARTDTSHSLRAGIEGRKGGGRLIIHSREELQSAVESGKLKSGDKFNDPDGEERTVK